MLVLKWEDERAESLATLDQFRSIRAYKHVACFEKDALKNAHYVLDFETVKQACNRLMVDQRQLIEARQTELNNLISFLEILRYSRLNVLRIGQVQMQGDRILSRWQWHFKQESGRIDAELSVHMEVP